MFFFCINWKFNLRPCFRCYHRRPLLLPLRRSWHLDRLFAPHISGTNRWIGNFRAAPFVANDDFGWVDSRLNMKCISLRLPKWDTTCYLYCTKVEWISSNLPHWMSRIAIRWRLWFDCGNVACAFGMQLWFALLSIEYKADPSLFRNCNPVTEIETHH